MSVFSAKDDLRRHSKSKLADKLERLQGGHAEDVDVSTQIVIVPGSPDGRKFLLVTPARQHIVDQASYATDHSTIHGVAV